MSITRIFTTRKLEKVVAKYISENNSNKNDLLGDWSSTLFYVSHKKCWLVINKMTKYVLIIENVKNTDLKNISSIFKRALHEQLIYDGIKVDFGLIEKIIGKLYLYQTDNDRSTNGTLNSILPCLEDWKYEFGNFENMPFRELNGRLNGQPYKSLNWQFPKEKMKEIINACTIE
jgi:hypothetical protein